MSQEQNFDLTGWWNEQSFSGKNLYNLLDTGELVLLAGSNIKERTIATIVPENADAVLRNLIERFSTVEGKVKELELEWQGAEDKLKLADRVAYLKDYISSVAAVGDYAKFALLVHDWEHTIYTLMEENYAAKLRLVEMAEELAGSDQWKETSQAFRDLGEKWKQSGHIDKTRNDKLWSRIEAARKTFMDRKRVHQEDEEKDLLANLDLKIDLVEQAESIAASEDWKKTTEAFHRLTEEWKTIGHTLNKKNEELWQRFLAAKSTFFEKKREHSGRIQKEHEANYAVKLALVERAEALKDSRDWNATTQAFAALMEEWKKSGRVEHEKGEELWKRFNAAQEPFFEAKKQHYDAQRAILENNYSLKKALYERAEALKHSNYWADATTEMMELLEEWKKIGPIPRAYGDKMWEDFNAARKFFFARKDANREQRKQYAETQKVVRAQQAKDIIVNLRNDIKEEEEKLVDFRSAIGNITPGKKADELKRHLERLIVESEQKLKKMQERYKQAETDMQSQPAEEPAPAANDQAES
jgi:hypothetical protein